LDNLFNPYFSGFRWGSFIKAEQENLKQLTFKETEYSEKKGY